MQQLTTAQALGKYRRELIQEGFKADVAEHMAVEAARLIVQSDGLGVSDGESA